MYNWKLSTAVKLAQENFLSGIQIAYDRRTSRPYYIEFKTRCGDTAQLVTAHTQKEKRKTREFSTRGAALRYLQARIPGHDNLLSNDVKVVN
ncbi:hypothetical protein Q3R63_004454 [Salmonella enterica]|nr:hypothetical protein [Salmonella enterica]ELM1533918.1 hypothetical protein [Salmonella enterica]